MTTSLITGGAGFIGSHLARALLAAGETVRVFDDLSTGSRANLDGLALELVVGDVLDADSLRIAARGADTIFHLAAMISVPRSMEDPGAAYRTNVIGSVNVLEAARREGVRRVVLSSSCAVYGDASHRVGEDAGLKPLSPYAASKLAMEDLARVYSELYGLEAVSLRYFNVFGPRQDPASPYAAVIPIFLRALLDGRPPTIHGDGSQSRDFVYVEDVVAANRRAATASGAAGQTFNVGSGASVTILELARALAGLLPDAPAPVFGPRRAGDILSSQADISRAGEALGYRPAHDLHGGLQATLEWMRSAA